MDWSQNQVRLFRALLHCYPAEFRHEYGTEMEHLFTERLRAESRLHLWFEALADLAVTSPREHWHVLASDVRYGARVLSVAPGFTAVSLLIIALGIGSTVAIFSLVNAVLLRSLPFGNPQQLTYLWSPNPNFKGVPDELGPNVPDFYEWQRLSHSFSAITMLRQAQINVWQQGSVNRVQAAYVGGNFFRTLDAWPAIGRAFSESDDQPGHQRVVVISHSLWQSQFASDLNIIGKQIQLNREPYIVLGIMPKDFAYPLNGDIPYEHSERLGTDLWLPVAHTLAQKSDRVNFESTDAAIGRLREGVSVASAQAELKTIEARLSATYPPEWRGWTALVTPLEQTIVGPFQQMFWLLLGAVSLVLLIAISNVANLLLVRATSRAHELGLRTALGAERSRIIRQLLTESLLLSCLGGVLGIALAYSAVHLLAALNPGDIPRFDRAAVDGQALLVALLLSVGTGILSGLAPAITASRFSINDLLRRGGSRIAGVSNKGRFAFVVLEVALSVILLTGSLLLVRSYLKLASVDPGFSPSSLTFHLNLDDRYNKPELRSEFCRKFLQHLQNMPGVAHVGASTSLPMSNQESATFIQVQGSLRSPQMVGNRSITADYFRALGTPLLRGRGFSLHDLNSNVVIVNQSFVHAYFHDQPAIGSNIRIGMNDTTNTPWSSVIGIVGDIHHTKLEEPAELQIFQFTDNGDRFAIQYNAPVSHVISQVRAMLYSLDPGLSIESVHTMSERITAGNARRSFQTSLLTAFAAIAIALALVGLYGLMSYAVKQRRAEIGLRLAIGSSRSQILRLILSQGMRLTAYGLVIGMFGSFALSRFLSAWLFGVNTVDATTFVAVPLFILTVACSACVIPAWNATRIDPIQALRQD